MIEWFRPAILRTSLGDLAINASTGYRYLCVQEKCASIRQLRVVSDPVPQGDGEIFHRRFTDGTQIDLVMQLWVDDAPACGEDLRLMYEALAGHLSAILNEGGRYLWTPTNYPTDRMMDEARWLTPIELDWLDGGVVELAFSIDSPFPYFIDLTQTTITLLDGVPQVVTMTGNADFFPVFIVDGPTSAFQITNSVNGFEINYDGARPGAINVVGGNIAEIDVFRNTIYLGIGGAPGDDTNLKPGIDPETTDYFALLPGAQTVEITGADATILVNQAWIP